MLWPVVKALLGHYRRYPTQLILVWLGLTLGVSLLSGVTAINHYALQSYQSGEKLFSTPLSYRIRPKRMAERVPQQVYVQLRRAGFSQCVRLDSYPMTTANGQELTLMGIDPTAMLPLDSQLTIKKANTLALMYPPYPVMVSADLAKRQKWQQGQDVTLDNGAVIGPIMIDHQGQVKGTHAIADLSVVRALKHDSGLGVIACGDMTSHQLHNLQQQLPDNLVVVRTAKPELQRLTHAFHLNLTAMGMLSFLVGLFIFYQAMSLSMIQRQPLVGLLRQAGVSHIQLAQAISIELVGLILVSWLCGNVFGLMLANQLIPSVSQSLRDLYAANVGLSVHWDWGWSFYTLVMATGGAFLSCAWPLIRLLKSPPIRLTAKLSLIRFAGREFAIQAILALLLIIAAVFVNQLPTTQTQSFILIGLILLSVALLTPYIIWKTFDILSFRLPWVKARWFFADAAASMSFRGIATMAFIIAMAANIGVETMVGSFRITTDKWLDERLAADLYLYPSSDKAAVVSHWLEEQPEVSAVWWRWEKDVSSNKGTLQIVSTGNSPRERDALTVKLAVPHYWYFLHASRSVMISETLALKHHLRPGQFIDLPPPMGKHWLISGVYYDYGNPYGQIMVSQYHWLSAFAEQGRVALAVLTHDRQHDAAGLKSRLNERFLFDVERVHSNAYLHNQAMKMFDRTFLITDTLGNITMLIAVFGIFFATVAGEFSRKRHVALLRVLGVSAKELVCMGALQLLVFWAIAVAIAIPLGIWSSQLMMNVFIKDSFGWTMDVQMIPEKYLQTSLLSMLALLIAGALPVLRLVRRSPMTSFRDAV